jgi:hypothetical protein
MLLRVASARIGARGFLFLTLLFMGCTAPVSEESGPENTPFCRRIRRCLKDKLPTRYEFSQHDAVWQKAAECLGKDATSIWTTRDCLPFEFAHDEHGLAVHVNVNCSDVCPMNAGIMLRYSEPVTPLECECMGAAAHFDPAWHGYQGCVPAPRSRDEKSLRVDPAFVGTNRYRVGGARQLREALGFSLPVSAIDGVVVSSREPVEQLLNRLPQEVPGSLTLTPTSDHDPRNSREIVVHYPPRTVFEELARVAQEIDFAHIGEMASSCSGDKSKYDGIGFAGRVVAYDRQCDKEVTRRLTRLATLIERAAAEARPRTLSPGTPPPCKELRTFPTMAGLREAGKSIELRYVDWLVR